MRRVNVIRLFQRRRITAMRNDDDFHEFANGGNAKGVKAQGNSQEVFGIFRAVFGPPGGREWAQNVAPGTSFRTPKYRPNPANGGPIGGKNQFWKDTALPP